MTPEAESDDFILEDLEFVFGSFGKIDKVFFKKKGEAYIYYQHFLEAFFAQRAMNNY